VGNSSKKQRENISFKIEGFGKSEVEFGEKEKEGRVIL